MASSSDQHCPECLHARPSGHGTTLPRNCAMAGPYPTGLGESGIRPKPRIPPQNQEDSMSLHTCLGEPPPCQISSLPSPPISCHDYATPWLTITPLTTPMRHPAKLHPGGSKVSRSIANSWTCQPFAAPCHAHVGTPCDKPVAKPVTILPHSNCRRPRRHPNHCLENWSP